MYRMIVTGEVLAFLLALTAWAAWDAIRGGDRE
jgi:hypothetical protein